MDIGNALRRAGRDEITIRSVISNTTKSLAQDILKYEVEIESVNIKGKKIFIKTGKALINSELSLLSSDIQKASLQKLRSMHIILPKDASIRFI